MDTLDDLPGVRPAARPPASPAQETQGKIRNLAHEASRVVGRAGDYVAGLVTQQVTQQKDQAAGRLGGVAGTLRELGTRLREEDGGGFGHYAVRAADQVDRLSQYLRDRDLGSFLRDTERFARRRPELFLGGTFLAGLLLARFLKSSSDRSHDGYEAEGAFATSQAHASYPGEPFGRPPEPHWTRPEEG